jgi:hypothetical protein
MERGTRNPNYPVAQPPGHTQQQTYGQSPASGPAPTTAGHHKHDILNKLDPRIDSTHDREHLATSTTSTAGTTIPKGTYGPHSSRIANALDPRVDSDLDSTRAAAAPGVAAPGVAMPATMLGAPAPAPTAAAAAGGGYMAQAGGGRVPEGTYGPHQTRAANALDPRVDSDLDNQRARHTVRGGGGGGGNVLGTGVAGGTTSSTTSAGTGVSHGTTLGPHRSDMANKLDPRVDSKTGAWKGI